MTHKHGETFTDEQGAHEVHTVVMAAVSYPQGDPQPIAVTMTDEEWNAVKAVLQVGLIIQHVEDMAYMPPWMAEQAHKGWHYIHDQVRDALGFMATNEIRDMFDGDTQ